MKPATIEPAEAQLKLLREDFHAMRFAQARFFGNAKAQFAYAFGLKFGAFAKGMSTWERDWCAEGIESRAKGQA